MDVLKNAKQVVDGVTKSAIDAGKAIGEVAVDVAKSAGEIASGVGKTAGNMAGDVAEVVIKAAGDAMKNKHDGGSKQPNKDNLTKVINEIVKKVQEDEEKNKVCIAFLGQPGAGKSSLINILIGKEIMPVGVKTDMTQDPCVTEYTFTMDKEGKAIDKEEIQGLNLKGVYFTDFPGHGTVKYPPEKLIKDYKLKDYDVFVCIFSNKLHDADEKLFAELYNEGKTCIFVRNQCDAMYQEGSTIEELKNEVSDDVIKRIGEGVEVLFTSCKTGDGIEELTEAIASSFPEAQRKKYFRIAKAYSDEFLQIKKSACESVILKYSLLSAANGLNPMAGLDIAIDLVAITNMFNEIKGCFGLDDQEIDTLADSVLPLAKDLAKCVTSEGIIELVKKFIGSEASKKVGKYVPVVGPVIIASTSFGAVFLAGWEFADKCYQISKLFLELDKKYES